MDNEDIYYELNAQEIAIASLQYLNKLGELTDEDLKKIYIFSFVKGDENQPIEEGSLIKIQLIEQKNKEDDNE